MLSALEGTGDANAMPHHHETLPYHGITQVVFSRRSIFNVHGGRAFLFLIPSALIAGAGWMAGDSVLRGVAACWIVSDEIKPADAIVVLGGAPDVRPSAAAALYKEGFASKVLVANTLHTTGKLGNVSVDSELNRDVL